MFQLILYTRGVSKIETQTNTTCWSTCKDLIARKLLKDTFIGEVCTYVYLYWLTGWNSLIWTQVPLEFISVALVYTQSVINWTPIALTCYVYQQLTANHMPDKSHMTLRCTAASSSFLLLIVGSRTVFIFCEDSCIPFHDGITMAITRESSVFTTYQKSTIESHVK